MASKHHKLFRVGDWLTVDRVMRNPWRSWEDFTAELIFEVGFQCLVGTLIWRKLGTAQPSKGKDKAKAWKYGREWLELG